MNKKTTIARCLIASFMAITTLAAYADNSHHCGNCKNNKEKIVLENILSRRSVRKFTKEKIDSSKTMTLLRAAMAAPTCRDMEPWHFIVLDNAKDIATFAGDNHHSEQIKGAPLVIVVCGDTARMNQGQGRELWVQDVSAATENLLLAAHAMGLGAVWTTAYPIQRKIDGMRKRLHIGEELIPLAVVLVGHPDEETEARNKFDEKKITWGLK